MAALGARGWAGLRPLHLLSAALMAIVVAVPAAADPPLPPMPPMPPMPWPDRIVVFMDQARLVQLPERAANVVIGNPLIADVSIQPGGLTVITGKSYGATNFIATDKRGAVLLETRDRTVVMYNGAERQTYSCTLDCSRRLTLGDTPDSFDKTLSEITSLNAQATAAGALSSGQIQLDSRSVGTNNSKQQQQ